MNQPAEDNHTESEVDILFRRFRLLSLGDNVGNEVSPDEIYRISSSLPLRTEFYEKFKNFSQDPDFKNFILEVLRDLSIITEVEATRSGDYAAIIDRYPGHISLGAILGGAGALLYGTVAVGTVPIWGAAALVVGGFVGGCACLYGSWKFQSDKSTATERHKNLERMIETLEKSLSADGGQSR